MTSRASRRLAPDDFEWALDHSWRRYWVRVARPGDNPNVKGPEHFITVVPVNGATPSVMSPRCKLFPLDWQEDDAYAVERLNAIADSGAYRALWSPLPPDAVRLGHDFGDWCVETYRCGKLKTRTSYKSLSAADAEVERLAAGGLLRLLDDWSAVLDGGAK